MPTLNRCRRPTARLLCASLFSLLWVCSAQAETLVIGTKESPPFAMLDEGTGEWSGISAEWQQIRSRYLGDEQ